MKARDSFLFHLPHFEKTIISYFTSICAFVIPAAIFGLELPKTDVHSIASTYIGLYHSSKAAVTIISETLRLELAPFGVTVITGMLGSIESNFHANDAWQGMPETSRYKAVEPQITKVAGGEVGPKKEKVEYFVKHFVSDVLDGASGQVWRGAKAQTVRAIGHHAPSRVLVSGQQLMQSSPHRRETIILTQLLGQHAFTRERIRCHGKGCREKVIRKFKH